MRQTCFAPEVPAARLAGHNTRHFPPQPLPHSAQQPLIVAPCNLLLAPWAPCRRFFHAHDSNKKDPFVLFLLLPIPALPSPMDSQTQTSESSSPSDMCPSPLLSAYSPAPPASSFSQPLLLPPFSQIYLPPDFFSRHPHRRRRFDTPEVDFSPDGCFRDSGLLLAPPPS